MAKGFSRYKEHEHGGLNKNGSYRLMDLDVWALGSGATLQGLGGVALLE